MFSILGKALKIAEDATRIVTAPVEIALDVIAKPIEEVAKASQELVDDAHEGLK